MPPLERGLVVTLPLFILIAYEDLRDRLFRLIGYGRLAVTTKALDEAGQRISRYVLVQSIINGTYGCAMSLAVGPRRSLCPDVGLVRGCVAFYPLCGSGVGGVAAAVL